MIEAGQESIRRPKIALLSTEESGTPNLEELNDCFEIESSIEVGIQAALNGADAAFLWDAALADELGSALNAAQAGNLKWVHAAVTGVDTLPLATFENNRITLTNAAGIYDDAIAEYAVAACLGFERKFPRLRDQQRAHEWSWVHGGMLKGRHILIVGPGRIGKACARLFRAFGCNVAALGRQNQPPSELFSSIEVSSKITEKIVWADHVVITAPLTSETHHMLNAQVFARCKQNAHIVNIGRGGIIDTDALIHALLNDQIAGATLDVLENEPLEGSSALWDMPEVFITPHIAGDVGDFEDALVTQFIENAKRWLKGKEPEGVVNLSRGY